MSEDEYLILENNKFKGHPIKILAFQDDGTWRAIIRCDGCKRHHPVMEMDPSSKESMLFVYAEVQLHASQLANHDQDGWHDGLGFVDNDEMDPDD